MQIMIKNYHYVDGASSSSSHEGIDFLVENEPLAYSGDDRKLNSEDDFTLELEDSSGYFEDKTNEISNSENIRK